MTTTEYLTKKKITPVIRIVAGSNKAEAFVTMTIEQFEEYGKHCAEKLLPTDDEQIEAYALENILDGVGIQSMINTKAWIAGATWMRDLILEKSKK